MVTFAMIKREKGYDPDNGDWEYVMMPNKGTTDYTAMPNGMLPEVGSEGRGKLANCAGCHNQTADGSGLFIRNVPGEIKTAQADIDNSVTVFEKNITGDKYGDASIAHNGMPLTSDDTFRDVYSNWASNTQTIEPGSIIIKHTYLKKEDGTKGDLAVTFAMVKREAGFWPEGGDWEYIMMPNDGSNDYSAHPNGTLPPEGAASRGMLANCQGCHAAAPGNNFLFVRN
jgi:mono/diheme cytochrome c family protein